MATRLQLDRRGNATDWSVTGSDYTDSEWTPECFDDNDREGEVAKGPEVHPDSSTDDESSEKTTGAVDSSQEEPAAFEPLADAGRFQRLAAEWKRKVAFMSSPNDMAILPEYQQIIGMGSSAVPLILDELRVAPDWWFWALKAITCLDPVPAEDAGNVDEMASRWIEWGISKGLISR